jgi:hypothetical protein
VPTLEGEKLGQFTLSDSERSSTHRLVVLFRGRDRANEPLVTSAQVVMPHPSAPLASPAP